jgi:hypothetical protein
LHKIFHEHVENFGAPIAQLIPDRTKSRPNQGGFAKFADQNYPATSSSVF